MRRLAKLFRVPIPPVRFLNPIPKARPCPLNAAPTEVTFFSVPLRRAPFTALI